MFDFFLFFLCVTGKTFKFLLQSDIITALLYITKIHHYYKNKNRKKVKAAQDGSIVFSELMPFLPRHKCEKNNYPGTLRRTVFALK